jgi:hypothetical protein
MRWQASANIASFTSSSLVRLRTRKDMRFLDASLMFMPRDLWPRFVTFVGFTCLAGVALSVRMSIFQCLRALVAEPNWLKNRLYLANVTMPGIEGGSRSCEERYY